jgi:hypothetical protein
MVIAYLPTSANVGTIYKNGGEIKETVIISHEKIDYRTRCIRGREKHETKEERHDRHPFVNENTPPNTPARRKQS